MIRSLRTLLLVLLLAAPLCFGGCFHHQRGPCNQPCQMKQKRCASCAPQCQVQCSNCPCKAAAAADDTVPSTK